MITGSPADTAGGAPTDALTWAASILTCPVAACGRGPLTREAPVRAQAGQRRDQQPLCCPAGHSFDVAKQGYVNLLGERKTASDTAEMVARRQDFLGAGHYAPIRTALAEACRGATSLLEAGAGTGYYLAGVLEENPLSRGIATDLSVPACKRAAKAHPRLASVVADTWAGLPIAAGALDAVCCVFAPRNGAEFARVLRPRGRLVVVHPSPEHLQPLREQAGLLEIQADKRERLVASLASQFELSDTTAVRFQLALDRPALAQLIGMGPNAFHERSRALPISTNVLISIQQHTFLRKGDS